MPRKKTQEEWDQAGRKAKLIWLESISSSKVPHKAQCLLCGHEWTPYPVNVSSKGTGCPKCGKKRGSKKQRIDPKESQRRAAENNVQWLELPENNHIKKTARCLTCLHEWKIQPRNLYSGYGCPKCGDRSMASKQRASQEQRDREAASVGIRWLEPVSSWNTPTKAECLGCGHTWKTRANDVQGGRSCPNCAISGYKKDDPGLLYLLKHKHGYLKIGITNFDTRQRDDRIRRLSRHGYQVERAWEFDHGEDALFVEQRVLLWIRNDLGIPPAIAEGDGYTETIPLSEISMSELEDLIELTITSAI
ncbi:MAG: hypothetical protein ACO3EZ_18345 [Prochlorotrichaceae cyanobacterium]